MAFRLFKYGIPCKEVFSTFAEHISKSACVTVQIPLFECSESERKKPQSVKFVIIILIIIDNSSGF